MSPPANRSWRSARRKYGRRRATERPDAPERDEPETLPPGRRTESDVRTMRSSPFASGRFHVLLNSLFKVLFNFPSRYLFAIGLVPVFSLRWSLPPALGCNLKQPDSKNGSACRRTGRLTGLAPSLGVAAFKRTWASERRTWTVPNTTVRSAQETADSVLGYSRFTRRY